MLHIAPRWSARGGADQYLLATMDSLAREGVEQRLAVGAVDGSAAGGRFPLVRCEGLDARTAMAAAEIDPVARAFAPDRIHLHAVVNPWVLEWAAGLGTPAVLSVQDHRFFCPGRGKWTRSGEVCSAPMGEHCGDCFSDEAYCRSILALTRRRLRAACGLSHLHVLSRYMRRELEAVGVDGAQIEVLPPCVHGLDVDAEEVPRDGVLFAGRLVAAKGVADAVAAWRESEVGARLVFAGTGSARAELEREGFEVTGWLDRERLAHAYRRCRVLVMPSRWQEPFGIAGLEALELGAQVAAWRSGGVEEWHPGPLAEWGDVEGLAAILRELWARPRREEARISVSPHGFAYALLALYARVT